MCCSSWGHKESDTTERLNSTELKQLSTAQRIYVASEWERKEILISREP